MRPSRTRASGFATPKAHRRTRATSSSSIRFPRARGEAMNRRAGVKVALLASLVLCGAFIQGAPAQPSEQVIRITVKRYDFMPNEIRLKKGVPVVLEFAPADVPMGISAPDLNIRADISTAKPTRIRVVPE